jgi:Glu-tRNA(Gln) amidotransferase subunit E-like FAD-binding protein
MQWEVVIGLEIHTQLTTRSKIFSGSSTTVRLRAEHSGQPDRPGHARRIAGAEPGSGAHGGDVRSGD